MLYPVSWPVITSQNVLSADFRLWASAEKTEQQLARYCMTRKAEGPTDNVPPGKGMIGMDGSRSCPFTGHCSDWCLAKMNGFLSSGSTKSP